MRWRSVRYVCSAPAAMPQPAPAPVASAAGLLQAGAAVSQQQGKTRGRSPAARFQSSVESIGECTRSRSEKRRQKKAAKKAASAATAAEKVEKEKAAKSQGIGGSQ